MRQKQTNSLKQKNENKSLKTKKRIFVFNIDPQNDKITSLFQSLKNRDLLLKHQDEIVYVFVTKFSLNVVLNFFEKILKLKTGYIISSNGSCLYSIANKKILYSYSLINPVKTFIVHEGILKSLLIGSNSKSKCYCYSEDIKKFIKLKYMLINEILLINDYLIYYHFIHENEFVSFIFYDPNTNILIKKYKKIKTLEEDLNIIVSPIENNIFSVSSAKSSPIDAYYKILEDLDYQIDIAKTSYFVLNSFDKTMWNLFSKHRYLNFEYLVANKNSLDVQFTIQNIFLSDNVIEIINILISKTKSFRIHSIVGDEKRIVNLTNKKLNN